MQQPSKQTEYARTLQRKAITMTHTHALRKRLTLAATILVAGALALTGCSGSGSGGNSSSAIKMGIEPWIGYGQWYVAQDQGFFKKRGIETTITSFNDDATLDAALASGKVDVANIASHTALKMIQSGFPITIVALLDASETADAILGGPGVTTVSDLKGKKVAYEEGTTSDLLLNYALAQNNMSLSDIVKVPMGANEAGAALIGGKVPAAVTYEPYISDAKAKDPNINVLFTASEKEGLISDVLVVNNDVLKKRPADIQKLVDSWGDAVDYYKANTAKAQGIIAKGVGSKASELTTAFKGVKYFSLADNATELGGNYKTSILPEVEKAAIAAKLLTGTLDLNKYIDTQFVTKK
jgi:NitT/TauT family transport system substrate-binding protein